MLRHINYIEIMILAVHRYSGRPILVRQLETLDIRLATEKLLNIEKYPKSYNKVTTEKYPKSYNKVTTERYPNESGMNDS